MAARVGAARTVSMLITRRLVSVLPDQVSVPKLTIRRDRSHRLFRRWLIVSLKYVVACPLFSARVMAPPHTQIPLLND
jgi:hypothetical protein